MLAVLRESGAEVVLMHRQGEPRTMQLAPHYEDVVAEIAGYLVRRIECLEAAGIDRARMIQAEKADKAEEADDKASRA